MIGTADPFRLHLTGRHIAIDHHMIGSGQRRHRKQIRRSGEREPMPRPVGGVMEPRAQKLTHRRMIHRRIEITHEHVPRALVGTLQSKFVQGTLPLPPIPLPRRGGVHGHEPHLLLPSDKRHRAARA